MQGTLHPVFTSRQLLLASTAKPVTPFGVLVSFIEFFNSLKLGEVLGRLMPFAYTSPNAIAPEQTLLAFVLSIIVAHTTRSLKAAAASLKDWTPLDAHYSAASFHLKLHGWSKERRFVVIRELERDDKSAVGRRLIEVPGYTYRVFVTNRSEAPETLGRDYNLRACIEQRIEELKNDLAADGFCLRQFFATEVAFLSVLFVLLR